MFEVFKKCTKCGEEKFYQNFGVDRSLKSGYSNVCKKCINLIANERYAKVKDELKAKSKAERAAKKANKEAEKQELLDRYGKFNKQNQ